MLKVATTRGVEEQLAALGPDAMSRPFPEKEIAEQLMAIQLPIAEALLDQSMVAGIGNIAKSEILFAAKIDPRAKACELADDVMTRLLTAIEETLWASYHNGGRWKCNIYRKKNDACANCRGQIRSIRQAPSKRATYFCPKCQRSHPNGS
jgi:endonuclease-8